MRDVVLAFTEAALSNGNTDLNTITKTGARPALEPSPRTPVGCQTRSKLMANNTVGNARSGSCVVEDYCTTSPLHPTTTNMAQNVWPSLLESTDTIGMGSGLAHDSAATQAQDQSTITTTFANKMCRAFTGFDFDSTKGYPGEGPPTARRSARLAGLEPEFQAQIAAAGPAWAAMPQDAPAAAVEPPPPEPLLLDPPPLDLAADIQMVGFVTHRR